MGTNLRRKGRKKPWFSTKTSSRDKKKRNSVKTASQRDPRYKTAEWKAKRETVLYFNPTCVYCPYLGQLNPSTHVDHIVKASEYDGSFYDEDNLVGCCSSCHSKKTSYETKGVRFDTAREWGLFFTRKWEERVKGF